MADGRYGVELRMRRWVGEARAWDVAAGYVRADRWLPALRPEERMADTERVHGLAASVNPGGPRPRGRQLRSDELWTPTGNVCAISAGGPSGL